MARHIAHYTLVRLLPQSDSGEFANMPPSAKSSSPIRWAGKYVGAAEVASAMGILFLADYAPEQIRNK